MRRHLLLYLAAGALVAIGGCYDPAFTDGKVGCTSDHRCPDDMVCVPGGETAVCYALETAPPVGASVQVSFTAPATLVAKISLQSFGIGKMGAPDEPRFGHYHLTFDDPKRFDSGNGYIAEAALERSFDLGKLPGPLGLLAKGSHTIWISLANNNHSELNPKVRVESNPFTIP